MGYQIDQRSSQCSSAQPKTPAFGVEPRMLCSTSRPMRLLVDGMNVIGSRPDGWWKDRPSAMRMLIERLRSYAAASGDSVVVFLDARPFDLPEGEGTSVEVVFAFPGPDAADDEIVKAA